MYQVRHRALGVFQGTSKQGMMFWHPISDTPELGLFLFKTEDEAKAFISNLINQSSSFIFSRDDLRVEKFDEENSNKLKSLGKYINEQLNSSNKYISTKAGNA